MDKFVIVNEDWEEEILERNKNPFAFDSIIEQKCKQVNRILLQDAETGWMIWISNDKIILIN